MKVAMNKEELLKKIQDGKRNDEWERSIEDKGINLGFAVTIILALIVVGIQLILKNPHWEVVGVPMIGVGVGDLFEGYKTGVTKKKRFGVINLMTGIMFMALAIMRW
jgi:hypothetical protein